MIWHSTDASEVLTELSVDGNVGLANGVAHDRLETYGKNVITKSDRVSFLQRFFAQLKSKSVVLLIITSLISVAISLAYHKSNWWAALIIIFVVVLSAAINAFQIFQCDKTLDNVKEHTNPIAKVLREGINKNLNAALLVPGDIILLSQGDYVPADARLIETTEFRCNESVLTGVEVPVEKDAQAVFEDIAEITDRSNMVFSGCFVVHGTAKAVVTATGMNTEMGKNSTILNQTGEDKLPLQAKLDNLAKMANIVIFFVCALIFIIGLAQNFTQRPFADMTVGVLLNAVVLAVAAIPEGLPAITTIVIALGVNQILRDKIIIKNVSAIELLGRTNVICCDKTGVFTRNSMFLSKIFDGRKLINLAEDELDEQALMTLRLATACTTLNNDSTEKAIEDACLKHNFMSKLDVDGILPHISEIPFDSERKTMTVITMINEKPFAIVKGAPETVVPNCTNCDTQAVLKVTDELAEEELRVICVAIKPLEELPANPVAEEIECDLTFVGLLGLLDPPRDGVIDDIAACDNAGIKTVMITGDNLITAKAIARRIGVLKDGTEAISGLELDEMSDDELAENIEKYSVFARVSPSDKLRIVRAWQKRKKIVAITGDSTEDADALAQADVGCAIGKYGADVAKGNADIIISNNRFSSVVNAIRESRGLFSNIKKSVYYLFACNFAELIVMLFGMIIFGVSPLAIVPLLIINLLIDSAPSISLSLERAEERVMSKGPSSSIGRIFDYKSSLSVLIESLFMAVVTLIAFSTGKEFGGNNLAMSMAFATLAFSQMFHCFNCKFEGTILNKNIFANKFMNISLGVAFAVMLICIFTPLNALLGIRALDFNQLIICSVLGFAIVPVSEILKAIFNK